MMRLSATLTRRVVPPASDALDALVAWVALFIAAGAAEARGDEAMSRVAPEAFDTEAGDLEEEVDESSSQTSMVDFLWDRIMEGCCEKHQALLDINAPSDLVFVAGSHRMRSMSRRWKQGASRMSSP
jgi:hypothetical protein